MYLNNILDFVFVIFSTIYIYRHFWFGSRENVARKAEANFPRDKAGRSRKIYPAKRNSVNWKFRRQYQFQRIELSPRGSLSRVRERVPLIEREKVSSVRQSHFSIAWSMVSIWPRRILGWRSKSLFITRKSVRKVWSVREPNWIEIERKWLSLSRGVASHYTRYNAADVINFTTMEDHSLPLSLLYIDVLHEQFERYKTLFSRYKQTRARLSFSSRKYSNCN